MLPSQVGVPGITGADAATSIFFDNAFFLAPPSLTATPTGTSISTGDIQIDAPDGLVFLTNHYQSNLVLPGQTIQTGTITTSSISGNGGKVIIDARDRLSTGSIDTSSSPPLIGLAGGGSRGGDVILRAGGDIVTSNITTGSLTLLSGDAGAGGEISLRSNGSITTGDLKSNSSANALTTSVAANNGGKIFVEARSNISTGDIVSESFSYSGNPASFGSSGDIQLTSQTGSIRTAGIYAASKRQRGNITLNANQDLSIGFGTIDDNTARLEAVGGGTGGDITLISQTGQVRLQDGLVNSNASEIGSGGTIRITAPSIVLERTELTATAEKKGNAGNIFITSSGSTLLNAGRLFTSLGLNGIGTGGTIQIETGTLTLGNGASIDTATFGQGNAGSVIVNVRNSVSLTDSNVFSITAGQGNAGEVRVKSGGQVSLMNSNISTAVNTGAIGNGGILSIEADSLILERGSQLQALTRGEKNASNSVGNSGSVRLTNVDSIIITGNNVLGQLSGIFTSSELVDSGQGGDITITNTDTLRISGGVLSARTLSNANGGTIKVQARTLELINGGQIITSTSSGGRAGDILVESVNATFAGTRTGDISFLPALRDRVSATAPISIAELESNDSIAQAQFIQNFFRLDNPTNPNPNVEFSTQIPYVSIDGSGSDPATVDYYSFEVIKIGTRAVFDIDTGSPNEVNTLLALYDQTGNRLAFNNTASANLGAGGSEFSPGQNFSVDPYLTYTFTAPGKYIIAVSEPRPQVSFDFFNSGIQAPATYMLQVSLNEPDVQGSANVSSGSGIFAQTAGSGAGGNITLNTLNLNLRDRAEISAQSQDIGRAGNINIQATGILSANDGNITTTAQSSGGAINIFAKTIRLRGDSDIKTNVASGEGGNITLTADSILALNDSDILAFAQQGRGGNITLNTRAFFGQNYRPAPSGTDPRTLDGNTRVDVNASGTVSGIITIPDTTFIQNSLTQLAQNLIDPNTLLANSCIVRSRDRTSNGSFLITGSGGLPVRPGDAPPASFPTREVRSLPQTQTNQAWKPGDPIVEPQGIYRLANGKLVMSRECEP